MPKRYREWLLKDNVAKPRSTKVRHAKKVFQSDDSWPFQNANPNALAAVKTEDIVENAVVSSNMLENVLNNDGPTYEDSFSHPASNVGMSTAADTSFDSTSDDGPAEAEHRRLNTTLDDSQADSATENGPTGAVRSDPLDDISSCSSDEESLPPQYQPPGSQTRSELDDHLYPGSRVTVGESMMLILGHCLRHNATKEATESLLQLIEAHLPKKASIPTSKYLFFRQFTNARESATLHFYCPSCLLYLGESQEQELHCSTCSTGFSVGTLTKDERYFLTFDIGKQVKDMLSLTELNFNTLSRQLSYDVGELTTSHGYHNLPTSTHDLSVTWNTDGVPLYESSGYSIWPLLLQINELPQKVRTKHMVLAGLWFGPTKPNMNAFLKPYVEQMNVLSSAGFQWTDSEGNIQKVRLFPGPCSVDTVARAMVMNMSQFNGSHGCGWCMHEEEVVRKGNGHVRVYPVVSPRPAPRTHQSFLDYAAEAETTMEPKYGVKGASVLFLLTFFTFPTGFVVDYMHAVCAGFVRRTACMWFDTKASFCYSLGSKINEVDRRLCSLRPTWEIPRLPRSLKVRKYWKASEWRNWLLFYSPVVLHDILPSVYYKNWLKFVRVMHFFLANTVAAEKLKEAGRTIYEFLKEYQELYGKEHLTYNAHLLLHLVESVEVWGPLWNYSAYAFEGTNGQLVQLVNGTRYASWQVVEKFCFLSSLPIIWDKCSHFGDVESKHRLMRYFLRGYHLRKHSQSTCGVVFFGKGQPSVHGMMYKKVSIDSFMYCTKCLDKSRRMNSYVCIDGTFGQIEKILATCKEGHSACACVRHVVFHLRRLQVVRTFLTNTLSGVIIYEVSPTTDAVQMVCKNPQKCMALQLSSKTFLCSVANTYIFEAT